MDPNGSAEDAVEIVKQHYGGSLPPEIAPIFEGLSTASDVQEQLASVVGASNARNILSGNTIASSASSSAPPPPPPPPVVHQGSTQSAPAVATMPAQVNAVTVDNITTGNSAVAPWEVDALAFNAGKSMAAFTDQLFNGHTAEEINPNNEMQAIQPEDNARAVANAVRFAATPARSVFNSIVNDGPALGVGEPFGKFGGGEQAPPPPPPVDYSRMNLTNKDVLDSTNLRGAIKLQYNEVFGTDVPQELIDIMNSSDEPFDVYRGITEYASRPDNGLSNTERQNLIKLAGVQYDMTLPPGAGNHTTYNINTEMGPNGQYVIDTVTSTTTNRHGEVIGTNTYTRGQFEALMNNNPALANNFKNQLDNPGNGMSGSGNTFMMSGRSLGESSTLFPGAFESVSNDFSTNVAPNATGAVPPPPPPPTMKADLDPVAYNSFKYIALNYLNNTNTRLSNYESEMIDRTTGEAVGTFEDVLRDMFENGHQVGTQATLQATQEYLSNFRPATPAEIERFGLGNTPPPPPPPPAVIGDGAGAGGVVDGVLSREEALARFDRNNDGRISRAELGGVNGLIGTVNSAGNTTHIAGMQVVSQESVDRSNIQNDIRNLRNTNDPAKMQQADDLERFFANAENGGLTTEQRQNLVIATTLQNADFNNPDRANTDYLAKVAAMTPEERAQALKEAQFVAGLASSGMFGVGQQNRPIGYQPVTSGNAPLPYNMRTGSADSMERGLGGGSTAGRQAPPPPPPAISRSVNADTLDRPVTPVVGAVHDSRPANSTPSSTSISRSINADRLPISITMAQLEDIIKQTGADRYGHRADQTSLNIWNNHLNTQLYFNSTDDIINYYKARVDDQIKLGNSPSSISRSVNADTLDRPVTPVVGAVHDSRPANSTPSSTSITRSVNADTLDRPVTPVTAVVHDSIPTSSTQASSPFAPGQGPGGNSISVAQPSVSRSVNADTAERILVPVAAPAVHDAFQPPNPAPVAAVVHDAHTAPTSATQASASVSITTADEFERKINTINASSYSQDIKNKAIQAVREGDQSSPADLLAWFNGMAGNAPAVHDAFQPPNPAPVAAPVAPAAPAPDPHQQAINLVNNSAYSDTVKSQAIAQIRGGNTSNPLDIMAFINGGHIGTTQSADALERATQDPRITTVLNSSRISQTTKNTIVQQINAGNTSDAESLITWYGTAAGEIGAASVPTGIPPAASSRTPSVIPAGGGSVSAGFRS